MEACYGEDITKTQLLKMKRAIAKCSKVDMPELDLPMFATPYRAIQALLNGAREMEKTNMARFQEVMKTMQNTASGASAYTQQSPQFIPGNSYSLYYYIPYRDLGPRRAMPPPPLVKFCRINIVVDFLSLKDLRLC